MKKHDLKYLKEVEKNYKKQIRELKDELSERVLYLDCIKDEIKKAKK